MSWCLRKSAGCIESVFNDQLQKYLLKSKSCCKPAGESSLGPSGLFLEVVFGYVTAFAPSYEVFAASRLLVGLMNGGIGVVCFVLVQEYVGKSYWAMTGTNLEVHILIQSQFSLFCEVGGI